MGDWQELVRVVFIGLIFSFLVAKLISLVISFKHQNLRVVREEDLPAKSIDTESKSSYVEKVIETEQIIGEEDFGVSEKQSILSDDDDDWEEVESTELDEAFNAATAFVAASVADRLSQKVSNDVQLQLYGFYKIATEIPCSSPQPSALKFSALAK